MSGSAFTHKFEMPLLLCVCTCAALCTDLCWSVPGPSTLLYWYLCLFLRKYYPSKYSNFMLSFAINWKNPIPFHLILVFFIKIPFHYWFIIGFHYSFLQLCRLGFSLPSPLSVWGHKKDNSYLLYCDWTTTTTTWLNSFVHEEWQWASYIYYFIL